MVKSAYSFSTKNLSTNYFNIVYLDVLNINNIDIINPLLLNNYSNLYYILSKNNITTNINNSNVTTYLSDKHIIKYNVTYDNNSNNLFIREVPFY